MGIRVSKDNDAWKIQVSISISTYQTSNMTMSINGSQERIWSCNLLSKSRHLLKAYLHIIREGISFGKLSRVPTCNIQDAKKMSPCPIYHFKIVFIFLSKHCQWMHLVPKLSNFNKLVKFRFELDTHSHTHTHTLKPFSWYDNVDFSVG